MNKIIIILYCCICGVQGLFSQKYLTKEQAWEDIDEYFETIAKYHPNMYWHSSEKEVDAYIMKIKKRIRDSVSIGEMMIYLSHSNYLFDEHTNMAFRAYKAVQTDYIFPEIEYRNGQVFFRKNHLKIDAINSIPVDSILAWQMELFGSDYNQSSRQLIVSYSREFQGAINDCDIYPPYKVSVKTKAGEDSMIMSAGINKLLIEARVKESFLYNEKYKFELYPREKIAIIRYNEVFSREDYPEIDSLLYSFFRNCKKEHIQYLFFDVSRNGGGYDREFSMFFPFLKMDKNKCYRREIEVKEQVYWEDFCIDRQRQPQVAGIIPFKGKVFVYQSVMSYSAAPDFCAVMKAVSCAILVGTETGTGIPLYAASREFNLKNSRLAYHVSTKLYKSESPRLPRTPEGYLLPDIEYPFLTDRLLNVEDCKKIIEKSKH